MIIFKKIGTQETTKLFSHKTSCSAALIFRMTISLTRKNCCFSSLYLLKTNLKVIKSLSFSEKKSLYLDFVRFQARIRFCNASIWNMSLSSHIRTFHSPPLWKSIPLARKKSRNSHRRCEKALIRSFSKVFLREI